MDLISKALLAKARFFDAIIKEKFWVMNAMIVGVKVNWSSIIFNVLVDMIEKISTGFLFSTTNFLYFWVFLFLQLKI